MSIAAALSIATGGLANINSQFALASQNIANASTPNYSVEVATQENVVANGEGLGVRSGPATRDVNTMLQAALTSQNATVSGLQTQQTALQALDALQGTPGQGTDLASVLGNLQDQFSTLLNDPSNQAQQNQVVSAATTLTQNINALSNGYVTQRQTAQDNIVSEVATLNSTLGTIDSLNTQITSMQAAGQSTADLENQRDAAVASLSQLVDVKVLQQPSGALLIATSAGLVLPTDGSRITTSDVNVQPATSYPGGGIPAITLDGVDITSQLQGGQIGANITLRDNTLPTDQAELDEFSQNLASRFAANGLTLFTDPQGNVPTSGGTPAQSNYVGFAGTIQVNAAVQADPSMVRDGDVPPVPALAGYTTIISAVLNNTLGDNPPLVSNTSGLGPQGNLNAPYTAPTTLGQLASTMVAAQAQESSTVTNQLSTEQAVQTTLSSQLSSQSGVNIDTEMTNMIQLQNAYDANAKVISTIQSMWTQLLDVIQ